MSRSSPFRIEPQARTRSSIRGARRSLGRAGVLGWAALFPFFGLRAWLRAFAANRLRVAATKVLQKLRSKRGADDFDQIVQSGLNRGLLHGDLRTISQRP